MKGLKVFTLSTARHIVEGQELAALGRWLYSAISAGVSPDVEEAAGGVALESSS